MSRVIFPPMSSSETKKLVFDFISSLAVGETISSATVTSSVWSGPTGATANVVSGSASISGTKVSQAITGGTAGAVYNLVCAAVTSTGQTLVIEGLLAVTGQSL